MVKIIKLSLLLSMLFMGGCQKNLPGNSGELDDSQREYILSKVNNYHGLIKLYREKLSRHEDNNTRYQLAEYYYLAEDFDSSRQYLKPLIANNPEERVLLLESKNQMELGHYAEAQAAVSTVLKKNVNNGEAWNMQGILLTQNGDFPGATRAFNSARQRFVDDDIVINNLAMLAIMQNDYSTARDYLLSLYGRGHASQKVLHNLVYVLVKLQDFHSAETILQQEKMVDRTEGLMEALAKVSPRPRARTTEPTAVVSAAKTTAPVVKLTTSGNQPPATAQTAAAGQPAASTQVAMTAGTRKESLSAKPLGIPEKASLSQTSTLKEVAAVRSGQHPGYFRMVLESRQAINFRELPGNDQNKRIFELHNVRLGHALLRAANDISQKYANINKVSFYQSQSDAVLVEFEFTHPLTKTNVFRLTESKTSGERLIFDIYG